MSEWHGYNLGSRILSVGKLPGREQYALYMTQDACVTPLAYFRSEEKARLALGMLDEIALRGVKPT